VKIQAHVLLSHPKILTVQLVSNLFLITEISNNDIIYGVEYQAQFVPRPGTFLNLCQVAKQVGINRQMEQYGVSTKKLRWDEHHLTAFKKLPEGRTVSFHFLPNRLRITSRSIVIAWKTK